MAYKIFMSNLGYLRGINGLLIQHVRYLHRHFYCSVDAQKQALRQLAAMIEAQQPDVCCFVEIDSGSGNSGNFNQLEALVGEHYPFFDIENKYAPDSPLRRRYHSRGKSNGFIARHSMAFEKIYFTHGTKRLIYKLTLPNHITLFFAHFSLTKSVRARQLLEVRQLIRDTGGDVILLGDFNIFYGFAELAPLLQENHLRLLNREEDPTFTFHRFRKAIDLCFCSERLAPRLHLRILPQPFSDHAALVIELEDRT